MIWLSWRLIRSQVAAVGAALVALAIALALTGPHLVHLYDNAVASCNTPFGGCFTSTLALRHADRVLQLCSPLVLLVPAVAGMFWGAPLVAREFETGSYQLVWTQSGTRLRWMVSKVGLYGLAAMATTGLLSVMVTWWMSPIDRIAGTPFAASLFERRDLVPVGYAAFAFALGVLFGALTRRTLPAMIATLVAFIAARLSFDNWIRPHLFSPLTVTGAFNVDGGPPPGVPKGSWLITNNTLNAAGRVIGQNGGLGPNGTLSLRRSSSGDLVLQGIGTCPHTAGIGNGGLDSPALHQAAQACADRFGLREVVTYQPLDRYWPFQWTETAIYVVVALAVLTVAVWFVRRRLSGSDASPRKG